MADRQILFSGPMVRALLAGTKSQERRAIKWNDAEREPPYIARYPEGARIVWCDGDDIWTLARSYAVGDRLYVREAWHAARSLDRTPPRDIPLNADIEHAATARSYAEIGLKGKLRPGMHMPRWASRLTLTVTDVRVERLQDISEADALAEGFSLEQSEIEANARLMERELLPHIVAIGGGKKYPLTVRSKFLSYWIRKYGLERWDGPAAYDNAPWVAAYTFTVEHGNIDALARAA